MCTRKLKAISQVCSVFTLLMSPILYEIHILGGFMENICRDFCHWDFRRQKE